MLPIFYAFSIEKAPVTGGSTFPCLLAVADELGEFRRPHVVKIFSPAKTTSTCREVFGNVLAQEFDLRVPPAALVRVEMDLITELKKFPSYASRHMEPGFYFGTELLENTLDYSSTLSRQTIDGWRPELIFAFDVLVRNVDRRTSRPNFFLHDGEPVLIDHEHTLGINQTFLEYLNRDGWGYMQTQEIGKWGGHVFFPYLREKARKEGQLDFGEFFEYLRVLNVNSLRPFEQQLSEHECHEDNFVEIINYLQQVKQHEAHFHVLLNDLLK